MATGKSQHRQKTQTHTRRTSPPHGRDVFQTHWNCPCPRCDKKRIAIRRLVDSFSQIPGAWIEKLAQHDGEFLPLPMWGTLFAPSDSADASLIRRLCGPIAAAEGDSDLECLESAGWEEVAETGVLAVAFDGVLLLGIHGAGYDFYVAHWEPLYQALGYEWHR
ncbi:MAG: hypothetical protein WD069_15355 [Planctomycetales bacterium]